MAKIKELTSPQRFMDGLILSLGAAPLTTLNISAGMCSDSTNYYTMTLASGISKRLDLNWTAGSGNGGLDTGARAANTTYHVYLIRNLTTGVVDAIYSASATAPTMPTGYTLSRRIGTIITDPATNIRPFNQDGNQITFNPPIVSHNQIVASQDSDISFAGILPGNLTVEAVGTLFITSQNSNALCAGNLFPSNTASAGSVTVTSGGVGGIYANVMAMGSHVSGSGFGQGDYAPTWFRVISRNAAMRLRTYAFSGNVVTVIQINGWYDYLRN